MRIIDLTLPVQDHFRWRVDRRLKAEHSAGDQFEITWIGWTVHGFTHVDAPRHMLADGATTSEFRLEQLVGPGAVVDLTDVQSNHAIDPALVKQRGAHIEEGDIVLLKTCWEDRHPLSSAEFWTDVCRAAVCALRDRHSCLLAGGEKAGDYDRLTASRRRG